MGRAGLVGAAGLLVGVLCAPGVDAAPPDAAHLPAVSDATLAAATHQIDPSRFSHPLRLDEHALADTSAAQDGSVVRLASDILFDFDSATPRPAASARIRELVAAWPKGGSVAITGYTDSVGTEEYNLALSRRRAEAVGAIVGAARPDLRLAVDGRGEADPVASNGTPERDDPAGRAQNRRVELRLSS